MNILCFTKCLKDRVDRKTDNSKSDYDLLVRLVLFFGRPEPELKKLVRSAEKEVKLLDDRIQRDYDHYDSYDDTERIFYEL